jgi:enoyl-CoA hydratase
VADDVVLLEVDGPVATVTLHRPDARNALNKELRKAIYRTMRELEADDAIRAVVLTGSDPAFCAGLDLKELGSGRESLADSGATGTSGSDADLDGDGGRTRPGPLPRMTKPVIGAVNGVAITGGFELALACDFLVASERARFADTHARVGIMPGWGLTVLLPEAVGYRRARELSTTGNFLDAPTALAWGLVNHVVPHEDLVPFARQLAADVSTVPAPAVRQMLATYEEGSLRDGAGAWALEGEVATRWQAGGIDPATIEANRKAVTERGRQQV